MSVSNLVTAFFDGFGFTGLFTRLRHPGGPESYFRRDEGDDGSQRPFRWGAAFLDGFTFGVLSEGRPNAPTSIFPEDDEDEEVEAGDR
jgi:hypothetical protein